VASEVVVLRELTEADAEQFFTFRLRALRDHPEAFGFDHEEWARLPIADIASRLTDPNGFTLGAFEGRLVGITRGSVENARKLRHRGLITSVYVAPEVRGRGVGRRLIEETIARLAARWPALEQVHLTVSVEAPAARALYTALGFERRGVEPNALKLGDRYVAEEHMVRFLGGAAVSRFTKQDDC
jgi:ribosomal protein S18 acetylase RimI-like enzyme